MPNAILLILSSCNNLGWGITQMDFKSSGFSPEKSLRTELEAIEEGNSMTRNNVRTPTANISEPRWGTFQAIHLLVLKIWNKLLRLDTQPLSTSAWSLPHMSQTFRFDNQSSTLSSYTLWSNPRISWQIQRYPTIDKSKDFDTKPQIRADS